jgi:hypothetical protein
MKTSVSLQAAPKIPPAADHRCEEIHKAKYQRPSIAFLDPT